MAEPTHPTNPDWVLFDPLVKEPPRKGEILLLVTQGGILTQGPWDDNFFIAWGYKPKIPESVKARMR